jgi:hypothetical protein
MPVVLTDHARQRMALRGITRQMIEETLQHPECTGTGYQNRLLAFRTYPAGTLKVVYVIEDGDSVVISVIWD